MSDGRRPGGLTALAVINFIVASFLALLWLVLAGVGVGLGTKGNEELGRLAEPSLFWPWVAWFGLYVVLMALAGVGYLGQKRVLGRGCGTAYAFLSIGHSVFGLSFSDAGFDIGTLIGLVYPVLTLILINTVFRDDLVY